MLCKWLSASILLISCLGCKYDRTEKSQNQVIDAIVEVNESGASLWYNKLDCGVSFTAPHPGLRADLQYEQHLTISNNVDISRAAKPLVTIASATKLLHIVVRTREEALALVSAFSEQPIKSDISIHYDKGKFYSASPTKFRESINIDENNV